MTQVDEKVAAIVKSRDFKRAMSSKDSVTKKEVLRKAADILEAGLGRARTARILYLVSSLICILLLTVAFIPAHLFQDLDVLFFFIRYW
jgi:hypothetical protein